MFKRRPLQDGDRPHHTPLPPPPTSSFPPSSSSLSPSHRPIPPRRELVFHAQLAHGSSTQDIKDFSNVKELYAKIASAFELEPSDIIFCTLNTPKIDMSRLLGGQIGLDDFIFTHIKGETKNITLTKQETSLGLTITDNGAGNAFIKRIRDGSVASRSTDVAVGDMIVSIDGRSLIGVRHYEVARLLKELPRYHSFDMTLVEPRKAFAVAPRGLNQSNPRPVSKLLDEPLSSISDTASLSTNIERPPTLRLKSDGQAMIEEAMTSWTKQTVERVDDLLESFMGIRDNQLAHVIVDLARDKSSVDEFIESVESSSSLGHFQFPPDFITELWSVIR